MPTYWDWSLGARGGRWNKVKAGEATSANGVVAHISRSLDYKVEVRNMEVWLLVNGAWVRKYSTAGRDAVSIFGSYYLTKDFSHVAGMVEERGPAGGMMFKTREKHWSHFYTTGEGNPRVVIPSGFQRLHVRAQYRLVGPAASTALVVGRMGADYYLSVSASLGGDVQPSAFIARHKFIGPQWTWFTGTTMSADEIRDNPPPAPSDWVVAPNPEPEPEPDPDPPPPPEPDDEEPAPGDTDPEEEFPGGPCTAVIPE